MFRRVEISFWRWRGVGTNVVRGYFFFIVGFLIVVVTWVRWVCLYGFEMVFSFVLFYSFLGKDRFICFIRFKFKVFRVTSFIFFVGFILGIDGRAR